jgi:glycosyltransferase involved in cell wall biosynthesis
MIIGAIPAYNEELSVGSVVLQVKGYVDKVIVVDDGSTDKTARIVERAGVNVVKHNKNLGYGATLKTCFQTALKENAEILVILDGDGQHNPDDIPKLIEPIKSGKADIVIGSRFLQKESKDLIPKHRQFGIKVLTLATNIGTEIKIKDAQSGFRAYSRNAIEKIGFSDAGMGASAEILMDAASKGLRIIEVPIITRYEGVAQSSERPTKHGMSVLDTILRTIKEKNPMLFFGIPGAILLLIGIIFGLYSIFLYYVQNAFAIGIVLLSMLVTTLGIMSIFTALILDSISRYARMLSAELKESRIPEISKIGFVGKVKRSVKYRGVFQTLIRAVQIRHPYLSFGLSGGIFIIIGIIIGAWATNLYYNENLFAVGEVLLSMLLIITGVIAVLSAFILDSLGVIRREFER